MDLNKVQIIGRLTADPEARTTPSGVNVTSFGVATNLVWTDSSGQKQEKPEFHQVVAWRKLGDIAGQYLKKGSRVYIEGRIQTRSWEGQDGNKRYRTEIIAENMIMLDSRGSTQSSTATNPKSMSTGEQLSPSDDIPVIQADEDIKPEDIPF